MAELTSNLRVGHAQTASRRSGVTVLLCPEGRVAGVDVRGAAPGTRETDLLHPANTVSHVHAIVLSGGSAFGLATAHGVMRYLAERGHGYPVAGRRVPIVPAAVLFDLPFLPEGEYPDEALGYAAAVAATPGPWPEGSVGAGAGATLGKALGLERAVKSGLGIARVDLAGGAWVQAFVAVNAFGDALDEQGQLLAGPRDPVTGRPRRTVDVWPGGGAEGANTTIGAVVTSARLTKAQAQRVAVMAHDGLARALEPVHTSLDGDTLFALGGEAHEVDVNLVGVAAARAVAAAVRRGVRLARGWPDLPALSELSAT